MRVKFIEIFISMLFVVLVLGLFNMQVIHGRNYRDLSEKNCVRFIPQGERRGTIIDRNGEILVDSVMSFNVVVLPQDQEQLRSSLQFLSRITGLTYEDVRSRYRRNYVSPSIPVPVLNNVDKQTIVKIQEMKLGEEGVMIQPFFQRYYRYSSLAAHAIGYLSPIDHWRFMRLQDYGYKKNDIVGYGGIEEKYDYYLKQEDGGLYVEVDHRGRFSRLLGSKTALKGKNIQLTLDLRLQKIVEDALAGLKGAIVVLDPNDGAVLAMASSPTFNPGVFLKKGDDAVKTLFTDANAPLMNRAVSGRYPPGSVFKLVASVAGLETNKIDLTTVFNCPGSLAVGRREFKCWSTHGDQDLIQAIAHSCDVFFYRVGLMLGPQLLHDYAVRLGLGKETGIELPYETSGLIPNPFWKKLARFQKWYDGDTANFVIGQGEVLTSPLQLTRFMSIFANNGKLVTPFIVKAIDGQDVSAAHQKITDVRLKIKTLAFCRQGLRDVVDSPSGTARSLSDLPVPVAGKTGTAETGGGHNHAWFAGFFPYEKPKYAFCVFLEKGGHGTDAAGKAKQMIEAMAWENML